KKYNKYYCIIYISSYNINYYYKRHALCYIHITCEYKRNSVLLNIVGVFAESLKRTNGMKTVFHYYAGCCLQTQCLYGHKFHYTKHEIRLVIIHSSSAVEHSPVNRSVAGSNPACGAIRRAVRVGRRSMIGNHVGPSGSQGFKSLALRQYTWPVGQVVKTSPFHGGITGSNPVRVTILFHYKIC